MNAMILGITILSYAELLCYHRDIDTQEALWNGGNVWNTENSAIPVSK